MATWAYVNHSRSLQMAEIDDQRQVLAQALEEWMRAGAGVYDVVDAIEALVDAKLSQRETLPLYPVNQTGGK